MEYVVGYCFSDDGKYVGLIRKNRPEWQKDKLNGIGGKIESSERPIAAMVREFYEEAGVTTSVFDWRQFLTVVNPQSRIWTFKIFSSSILDQLESKTDEQVSPYPISELYLLPVIDTWRIFLALENKKYSLLEQTT